ncbi:amidophosphoribosyltransferase [Patescibacteria group bacterium]|nr:amidophosphoribosyltransferase [Patescibacteria group bacterium]
MDQPPSSWTTSEKPREKCGVFGVYGLDKDLDAARLTYFGLYALQHRGQEGSGIVSSDTERFFIHKGTGLMAHVYDEQDIKKLRGQLAIGHNRYSTSKGTDSKHTQPVVPSDQTVAVAHNGNLPSTRKLEVFLTANGVNIDGLNDSALMAEAIRFYLKRGASLQQALETAYPLFTGAFSLLVMTNNEIAALRDPCGIRPLSIGILDGGYAFSSETCAFDTIHARFLRDVEPGELVIANQNGLRTQQLAKGRLHLDIFEFIYFARPDSVLLGQSVDQVRFNFGVELAREYPVDADVVVPVPDSAIPAAMGFAQESGIPFYHGLIKNRYIGRTFIQPEQHLREWSIHMKLNPLRHVIEGKRIVLVDDSIVRGNTSKRMIELVRKAGAKEVHFAVSSPPYRYPDFYGIDTPDQEKLLAFGRSVSEMNSFLKSDSLHYLSLEGLFRATGRPADDFCAPVFTGVYPVDIAERQDEVRYLPSADESDFIPEPFMALEPMSAR